MKIINKTSIGLILISLIFFVSACSHKEELDIPSEEKATPVEVQTVEQSLSVSQEIDYPATVAADREAKIIAKTSGNINNLEIKMGDQVSLGQQLAKIDDINSNPLDSDFKNNQIKQTQIALEQAQANYQQAKDSYNNLLISSVKDLRQAEIARDQAASGKVNVEATTEESLESAALAYETAKISTEQARINLENNRLQAQQNIEDARENARTTAESVINTSGTVIIGINNITGFDYDNSVSINYENNLGAMDPNSVNEAKKAYEKASEKYEEYLQAEFENVHSKVKTAKEIVELVKKLVDDTKYMFDKTISSNILPQSSITGTSLSGLQSTVAGYQTQINTSLTQINGADQALTNVKLSTQSLLDSLTQAYELAKQQEARALQNLDNLQAGNISQKDQAGFAFSLAQNQYENLKVKLESQISSAKARVETAKLQYNNALVTLENLYDIHSVISPLDGTITNLLVSEGESVSASQSIATVSQLNNLKIKFYVEPENLNIVRPGLPILVIDDKEKTYNGVVSAVSLQADPITRRFLAEAELENSQGLFLGTVVTVRLEIPKTVENEGEIIIPLSALTVGQNQSFIFISRDNSAQKKEVELKEVMGELARVKADLPAGTLIIIEGSKLLQEGEKISFN